MDISKFTSSPHAFFRDKQAVTKYDVLFGPQGAMQLG